MSREYKIFQNANGLYYITKEDKNGFHRQPPSWMSEGMFREYKDAKKQLKRLNSEHYDHDNCQAWQRARGYIPFKSQEDDDYPTEP